MRKPWPLYYRAYDPFRRNSRKAVVDARVESVEDPRVLERIVGSWQEAYAMVEDDVPEHAGTAMTWPWATFLKEPSRVFRLTIPGAFHPSDPEFALGLLAIDAGATNSRDQPAVGIELLAKHPLLIHDRFAEAIPDILIAHTIEESVEIGFSGLVNLPCVLDPRLISVYENFGFSVHTELSSSGGTYMENTVGDARMQLEAWER